MGRLFVVAFCLLLTACAHTPPVPKTEASKDGQVSYEALPAGAEGRYKIEANQSSFGAQIMSRNPPIYPPGLVAENLPPATIRAKVIVDGDGKVSEVRDLDPQGDAHHEAFLAACREAALRWTYTPMTIVQDHEGPNGQITQTRHTVPFSLDYAFHFELKDGVPTVSSDR
ncbi:MAG: hypothetical protein GAK28_01388 [Luteibacter sp.]|uniref:hypothetical protein n=1 Tax=Luteibacter sp. TaxID=1886636 RepID=UPI001384B77C|nr:hypothetical protein [Luteibacter sp.]KAF1007912.1 MAG: hypothetical protein GAK28_01388 [Luteibacter sp.]